MAKPYKKPNTLEDVIHEMTVYCEQKGISLSDYWIRYMAEECYLTFEAKAWDGIKYWPAIAKRWVLTNSWKYKDKKSNKDKSKLQGKSVRDRILEEYDEI